MDVAQLLADQSVVFSDFPPEDVTVDGVAYWCLVLQWREGNAVEFGGFSGNAVGKIAIERSAVSTLPAQGAPITFRGNSYQAGPVDAGDAGASITIDIEAVP